MIRVAIVGLGGVGQKHFRALQEIEEVEITALIDRDKAAYTQNRSVYPTDIHWYASLEACIDHFDVLYVCTPPPSHEALSITAMSHGKDVFCEKPISNSIESALRMIDCAQSNHRSLCIGYNMRYRPSYLRMKQLIDESVIGKALQFWSLRIGMLTVPAHNWRVTQHELVGMTVESLSHEFDTIRWLFGEIETVSALIAESHKNLPGFDDNSSVRLKLASGAFATITASWSSHLKKSSRGIVGTTGSIEMFGDDVWSVSTLRWQSTGDTCEKVMHYSENLDYHDYAGINRAFIGSLAGRPAEYPDGTDGLMALKASLAVLDSAKRGGEATFLKGVGP